MTVISRPEQLGGAWRDVHYRVVRWTAASLPNMPESILEVGTGRGQITLPLAECFPGAQITAIDRFRRPYAADRSALEGGLAQIGAADRATVVQADALRWMARRQSPRFDLVVSSEFLPELDAGQMADFFRGCYKLLRKGGTTAHLFLSPNPRNERQRLVVEADSDPRWSSRSSRKWFSPPPRQAADGLAEAGFTGVHVRYRIGGLAARGEAARSLLAQWGVDARFGDAHDEVLRKSGLELPDWVLALARRGV